MAQTDLYALFRTLSIPNIVVLVEVSEFLLSWLHWLISGEVCFGGVANNSFIITYVDASPCKQGIGRAVVSIDLDGSVYPCPPSTTHSSY